MATFHNVLNLTILVNNGTLGGGSLGLTFDEERSQLRYVVRIAGHQSTEYSNAIGSQNHLVLATPV